jgi:hypothetical protein
VAEDGMTMKKPTVKYGKGEIGRVRVVEDFLPSPDRLVVLSDAQVAEVRRRRVDPNRKLVSHAKARKRIERLGS